VVIAYVLGLFPSYSEYFILNEILALRKQGFKILVLSINKGPALEIDADDLYKDVLYGKHFFSPASWMAHLYVFQLLKMRYLRVLKEAVKHKPFSALQLAIALKNFSLAVYFIFRLRKRPIHQLHAHFLSLPASVAVLMSKLMNTPFSCSAHAHDIYITEKSELVNKILFAKFVITCTRYNAVYLSSIVAAKQQVKIHQIYHGIELDNWKRRTVDQQAFDQQQIQVLTVARLVEKKGLIYLLQAVKILKEQGYPVTCSVVGDGPLLESLQNYLHHQGLKETVHLHGALPQKEIISFYEQADVFVLPCIETAAGDKDGLPNVLLEALAVGIPVIATSISAVPELIDHEVTGLFVPQKDAASIAKAILRLKNENALYNSIIMNGWEKVKAFDIQNSTNQLCTLFADK
jgi:colanic acid/amylovoran biosynthesis glycosyltransferase